MFSGLDNSFAIAIAPAINQIVKTVCLAIQLWLLNRYGIIKPTSEKRMLLLSLKSRGETVSEPQG